MRRPFSIVVLGLALCSLCTGPGLLASTGPGSRPAHGPGTTPAPGSGTPPAAKRTHFPYKQAGLTERQAAAHLLSRFTYGPTPGQIDEVVHEGLERWFSKQLEADLPEDSLNRLLGGYDALQLTNAQVRQTFPRQGEVLRMMRKDGTISSDSAMADPKVYKDLLKTYMDQKGFKPIQELYRQFYCQKVLRAIYTNNQVLEVMTDFWFNHFNVSVTKGDCAEFIPAYERDVIRPNALGHFGDLLLATAKSPAMLYYLDNFSSTAPVDQPNGKNPPRRSGGINENYAREVMELHTMGVDGGYTQSDVTQAARVLTGWTVFPMGQEQNPMVQRLEAMPPAEMAKQGFVHDGDFVFIPNRHDKGEKTVLGKTFGPDEGYDEGVRLLDILAHHPSTAHFLCKELATRFVCDTPSEALVDRMAKTFLAKNGDIRQVLLTMVSSPEFWGPDAVREKIKSPFELAISSIRSLHATVDQPFQVYNWVSRMGERLYSYQAPTGFPDRGQYWINTGSLLNRMNFGLAIASGRIPGVRVDLAALNNHHEPESAEAALETYAHLILPERKVDETIRRLTPMVNDPALAGKVQAASKKNPAQGEEAAPGIAQPVAMTEAPPSPAMLSQVVGVIIGSPEFQRR
ncbi:DUF1800 domain-containing protein [Dinghuibacter silviterrae]|uniref:Uncharacterized protein (DUF1800 family) n=1 Tax=Dinghuibacter silviterrae TaxID=1539049 RepID=A0A4R8DFU9_9BACT|nr:DUF1800 domain-containing protein [Dinghuibacter silviterrae]TDW96218.1 uncharacterized protein (DUF1800 family) [Dinghuibacter silviterrae]